MPIALRLWQQTRGVSGPSDDKPRNTPDDNDKQCAVANPGGPATDAATP
jgi:hypothetical protein